MANEELKPCPFCAGEAEIWTEKTAYVWDRHIAGCVPCGVRLYGASVKSVVESWNRRAPTQEADHAE